MKNIVRLALPAFALTLSTAARAEPSEISGLVGTWTGKGTLSMGADKAKVDLTWRCQPTAARSGVSCALRMTGVPGLPTYEETDLFGYEPSSGAYHWFSVTNAGETHDHVTKVAPSHRTQFVYTGTQGGKPFREVIDLELGKDRRTIAVRAETFVDGMSTSVLDVKAHK